MRATISVATCLRNQGRRAPWSNIAQDMRGLHEETRYPWCHECPEGHRAKAGEMEDVDMSQILAQATAKVERENQTKKMCTRCGETKPSYAFSKNASATDGLQHYCKACQRELDRQRRAKVRAAAKASKAAQEVTRVCAQCGQEKPIAEFAAHTKSSGGRLTKCRDCMREYLRQWKLKQSKTKAPKEEAVNVFDLPVAVTEQQQEPTVAEPEEIQAPITETANEVPKAVPPEPAPVYERYLWIDLARFPEVLAWLTELAEHEDRTAEAQVRYMLRQQHRAHVACNGE